MCGKYGNGLSRTLALLLVLLVLSPLSLSADVVLTDAEYGTLMKKLERAQDSLTKQEQDLKKLESELTKAKSTMQKQEKALSEAKSLQEKSSEKINQLQQTLETASKSLKKLKSEQRAAKAKAFCIGAAVGAVGGLAGGYYLTR